MHFLALAARGTLDVVAEECRALSLKILKVDGDGVHLDLSWRELAKALIHLRVAQRLLLELGHGNADDGETLYYAARRIDWGEWLDARSTFAVYASGDTVAPGKRENGRPFSGLTDMRFVALRVKDAIADDLTRRLGKRPDVDRNNPQVTVVVRGRQGRWSFYLDPSDPPLFQRGTRVDPGPAPLKETLAAACVDLSGWNGKVPLLDPMCGSGTLLLEAAGKALGIAPGCTRTFAVERWPQHDKTMSRWCNEIRAEAVAKARAALTAPRLQLRGSDNDAWSVQAAQRNVEEAGLSGVIRIDQADATRLPPQAEGTLLLTNPPYGERLGGTGVTELYEQLGRAWRGKNLAGVHVLSGHEQFLDHFAWTPLHSQRLANGALEVELISFAPHR